MAEPQTTQPAPASAPAPAAADTQTQTGASTQAAPPATEIESTQPLVADETILDDGDSALSMPASSLTSLRSSVMQYQVENGRTYHAVSSGKYVYPNDEAESDRLDLQHNLWLLTLRGNLCLCPKNTQGAKRVLDVGTGTGIWAIEYADMHPESEVIGVDLSPIQPGLIPPNCSFEIDDLEKEWTWTKPFDFIFSRVMAGSFEDYQAYADKAFAALEPGGWFELQDISLPLECDDGTMPPDSYTAKLGEIFVEGSAVTKRPIDVAPQYKDMLAKAGFVDIVEKKLKWPLGPWPKDPHYKEVGEWYYANLNQGLEGLTLAILTRVLQWSTEEAHIFLAKARKSIRDQSIHAYCPIYVVYGRKP